MTQEQNQQYSYFVSYSHCYGFGNAVLDSPVPLTTYTVVKDIQQWLRESQQIKDPILLHWIPLER